MPGLLRRFQLGLLCRVDEAAGSRPMNVHVGSRRRDGGRPMVTEPLMTAGVAEHAQSHLAGAPRRQVIGHGRRVRPRRTTQDRILLVGELLLLLRCLLWVIRNRLDAAVGTEVYGVRCRSLTMYNENLIRDGK